MKSNDIVVPEPAGASSDPAPAFEILGTGTVCTIDGICQVEDLGEIAAEVAETPSSKTTSALAETATTAESAAAQSSGTATIERNPS